MSNKPIPEKPTASPAAAAPEAGTEAIRLLHSAVEVLSFYAKLSPGMRADSDGSLAKAWLDAHPTIPAAPSPRPPEPEGRLRLLLLLRDAYRALLDGETEIERLAEWMREIGHPTQDKTCDTIDHLHAAHVAIREGTPLPEKPSESRAASAGEGALRAQIRKEAFEEAARYFDHAAERSMEQRSLSDQSMSGAWLTMALTERGVAARIRALAWQREASDTSAPKGPSKAVESGAALAPAQREGKP